MTKIYWANKSERDNWVSVQANCLPNGLEVSLYKVRGRLQVSGEIGLGKGYYFKIPLEFEEVLELVPTQMLRAVYERKLQQQAIEDFVKENNITLPENTEAEDPLA